jgi:hypothetical protein
MGPVLMSEPLPGSQIQHVHRRNGTQLRRLRWGSSRTLMPVRSFPSPHCAGSTQLAPGGDASPRCAAPPSSPCPACSAMLATNTAGFTGRHIIGASSWPGNRIPPLGIFWYRQAPPCPLSLLPDAGNHAAHYPRETAQVALTSSRAPRGSHLGKLSPTQTALGGTTRRRSIIDSGLGF